MSSLPLIHVRSPLSERLTRRSKRVRERERQEGFNKFCTRAHPPFSIPIKMYVFLLVAKHDTGQRHVFQRGTFYPGKVFNRDPWPGNSMFAY